MDNTDFKAAYIRSTCLSFADFQEEIFRWRDFSQLLLDYFLHSVVALDVSGDVDSFLLFSLYWSDMHQHTIAVGFN